LDDVEINDAVVHVGGMTALDAVVYKLASRGFEPIPVVDDTSYPCPKIFSASGQSFIAANSPSSGRLE